MQKANMLNYITLILGILTIVATMLASSGSFSIYYALLFLILTIIVRYISKIYNKIAIFGENKRMREEIEKIESLKANEIEIKTKKSTKKAQKTKKVNTDDEYIYKEVSKIRLKDIDE